MRLVNAVGSYHQAQLKRLSGREDAVGEYHWDLQPILEVGQTPQVEVVMECVTLGVDLDAFPEEN